MTLIPVNFPPGLLRNGTPHARRGRWTDGNLVRWQDNSIRPIGGWTRRQDASGNIASLATDPTAEAVRDIFSWRDNGQGQNTVFGSNLALYHMGSNNVITDVTYVGYTPLNSSKNASTVAGYGQNPYGGGAYGAENNLVGADPNPPDRWYFDNFGEILLTGVRDNGGVYELDLSTLTLAAVSNAPSVVQDLIVTDERSVFTVGAEGDPRRLKSSDVEDRTDWTPAIANQAIDRTIAGTGRLLRCIQVLRQVLILGEDDAHAARYVGPPYVYSVDEVGTQCGLISAEAVTKTDKFAVWWGDKNFWLYDGSLQVLECDVIDFIYDDYNPLQVSKISCFTNTTFSEIWWLYQSKSTTTTEVDSYLVWNYKLNSWYTGRLDRTAGIDRGTLSNPVMVSSNGFIYNHEQEAVIPDGDVFVQSGAIVNGEGENNLVVHYIYPDSEEANDLSFTLYGRQFPTAAETTFGPYDYNNPTPVRAYGRAIRFRADFHTADAELGVCRLDVSQGGER